MGDPERSEGFEKLEIWRRSCRLSVRLYEVLRESREFGFREQLTRAGLSIPSNIAEGYERRTNRDFLRFLWMAKASCGEVRTQALVGIEAGLLPVEVGRALAEEARDLSKMIGAFIRARKGYEK
jgi:four helix bundle protein